MAWSEKETVTLAVAIIGSVGLVIVALINRKKPKDETSSMAAIPSPILPSQSDKVYLSRETPISPKLPDLVSDVTHSAICAQLENLTPYHRGRIEKSYVGFRVRWRIILHSLDETDDTAHLFGKVTDTKDAVECNGTKKAFLSLIHAADGEEIEVEGTIRITGSGLTILDDCVPRRLQRST